MGDNVTSPSGQVFATDYNATEKAHFPLTKLAYGTRDTDYNIVSDDVPLPIGSDKTIFRDGFDAAVQPDTTIWSLSNPDGHIVTAGGNASGSSYLRISLSPLIDSTEVVLASKTRFGIPLRIGVGLSISQRIVGQEVFVGILGDDGAGNIDYGPIPSDLSITGATATIVSNVATFIVAGHGITGGQRVNIINCQEPRLNVGPVIATIVDNNTFTVPCTLVNGTYSATGGVVRFADPFRYAKNGAGMLFENATVTNGSFISRRNNGAARILNNTTATTTATQSNTSPFTDAFNAASTLELYSTLEEVEYRSFATESLSTMSGVGKWSQGIPDQSVNYKLAIRARTLSGCTLPVGRITNISKSGSTTATVTTDVAHNLATSNFVMIYGVRDQTNFANLTTQTVVASVIDAFNFTVVLGSSVTASSSGGVVYNIDGSMAPPGIFTQVVQSISQTSNIITVVGNATWATPLPGEYVHLYGMQGSAAQYDGAYKVLGVSTTSLFLQGTGAGDYTSITTGGVLIRRTDVRVHFARVLDYNRLLAEVVGGKGNTSDVNNAVPVSVTGSATVPVSQSTGVNTVQWNAAGYGGLLVNDVISAALTLTTTTAAVTPGALATIGTYAHSFNTVVTAVSGTNPTYDLAVEESIDNGTNWVRTYEFPRITAIGAYTSPLIRSQFGTRFRYVQTVTGTTPSFTRTINRVEYSSNAPLIRSFIDRTIVSTTLSSTTPVTGSFLGGYNIEGCDRLQLVVSLGAGGSVFPSFVVEGSEDPGNANWYQISPSALATTTASTTYQQSFELVLAKFVRVRVSVAGTGTTINYVALKAFGN